MTKPSTCLLHMSLNNLHLINELIRFEKWTRLDPLFEMGEIEIDWILYVKMFIMYINDLDECSKQNQIIYDRAVPLLV